MSETDFGDYEGKKVKLITLTNSNGMRAELISYGATLKSLIVKDKYGIDRDVVLGYNQINGFINDDVFMGATVGRVCNRIAYASFELDDKKYHLPANNGKHHLHGGGCLSKRVWEVYEIRQCVGMQSVKFTTVSRDGEFGYPSDVRFEVTFEMNDYNKLNVLLEAFSLSDTNTIVNLTIHPYFNLDPQASADVLDHELSIKANTYLPVDETALVTGMALYNLLNNFRRIPFKGDSAYNSVWPSWPPYLAVLGVHCMYTILFENVSFSGEICSLNGDLKKLREGVCLKELKTTAAIDIDNDFILDCKPGEEALRFCEICSLNGDLKKLREGVCLNELKTTAAIDIDNDFILDCKPGDEALRLRSERSGIILAVSTSYPIIHLYLAQHFNNVNGKIAQPYGKYAGIAIEAQKHSNAINIVSDLLLCSEYYGKWLLYENQAWK
uniref:Galactose mutarotase n=1 Tax=Ascaris lumbricoides TaxID=6252 RepID=A0A0M3IJ60_ASCLU